jgi:hypothetical protein
LDFDAATHQYRVAGALVPSVTTILRATGVSVDFEAVAASSRAMADAIALKREIGTALHADAHAFDDNDLDLGTVDSRVLPYLDAWMTFRANTRLTPLTRERRVYHPQLRYAGTLDGIFLSPVGRHVLVDIKTGDPDDGGCQFQTVAYQMAHAIDHPNVEVHERWGVQLTPGLSVPYRIAQYTDWRDAGRWEAIVTTYYAQVARRKERAA